MNPYNSPRTWRLSRLVLPTLLVPLALAWSVYPVGASIAQRQHKDPLRYATIMRSTTSSRHRPATATAIAHKAALTASPTFMPVLPTRTPAATATTTPVPPTYTMATAASSTFTPIPSTHTPTATVTTAPTQTNTPTGTATTAVTPTATVTTAPTTTLTITPTTAPTLETYQSVVLADNPLAYWRLDEASGVTAHDSTGANNGTYVGAPTLNAPGALGGDMDHATALRGGASGDSVQVPASASLDIGQGTLEVWFKANDAAATQQILTLYGANSPKFALGIANGHFYPELQTSSGNSYSIDTGVVVAGAWYHFVGTYRPSDGFFRAYVNGQQVAQVATDGSPLVSLGQAQAAIGGWGASSFNGTVDEAAVYPSALTPAQIQAHYDAARYLFGTLNVVTNQDGTVTNVDSATAAGLKTAELEVGWDWYETSDGTFSDPNVPGSYAWQKKQQLLQLVARGFKIVLSVNTQGWPQWVANLPGAQFRDQFGDVAPNAVNYVFSQTVRSKAEAYIARVLSDMGVGNIWAIRVGSGWAAETLLPGETAAAGHTNEYWAFDANAQGMGSDRPATLAANPYPGWHPGDTTWDNNSTIVSFTPAMARTWLDWYIGALADEVNWQIRTFKAAGFTGYLQVLMPGWGTRPAEYTDSTDHLLNGIGDGTTDPANGIGGLSMNGEAAVWNKIMDDITDKSHVMIDISSVDDNSSQAYGGVSNLCQSSDVTQPITNPQIIQWSSTRWIAYNADRYNLPKIGENPDRASTTATNPYGPGMMRDSLQLVQSCGLRGLLWAFDSNLSDGVSGVTFSDYADAIAPYPR